MTRPLYFIGRFCCRHHYPVIAVWLVATVALVVSGQASGDKTNDNLTLVLLRGRAWWMPGLLERTVPHISIEDDSFLKQRDAAAAAAGKPAAGS